MVLYYIADVKVIVQSNEIYAAFLKTYRADSVSEYATGNTRTHFERVYRELQQYSSDYSFTNAKMSACLNHT